MKALKPNESKGKCVSKGRDRYNTAYIMFRAVQTRKDNYNYSGKNNRVLVLF